MSSRSYAVAVFGAAGHTGRFVVAELLRCGITPIAIARDPAVFTGDSLPYPAALCRTASVHDADSLDRAVDGAQAIINCAGPFLDTAGSLIAAALRARIHYLDVTAEQASARETLDRYDVAARKAAIAIIPAMGFYGGFSDLLVTAAMRDWDDADTIDILIGLDSWHPTRGTRNTGARNTAQRMVIADGRLSPLTLPAAQRSWDFGGVLGTHTMVEVPLSEVVLIERHVKTAELHTWLSQIALDDIRDSKTPPPKPADAAGRSAQQFVVDAVVRREGRTRRIIARGRDIYAFSASLTCEVTARLVDGRIAGVGAQAPGAILNAQQILSALTPDHLDLECLST